MRATAQPNPVFVAVIGFGQRMTVETGQYSFGYYVSELNVPWKHHFNNFSDDPIEELTNYYAC